VKRREASRLGAITWPVVWCGWEEGAAEGGREEWQHCFEGKRSFFVRDFFFWLEKNDPGGWEVASMVPEGEVGVLGIKLRVESAMMFFSKSLRVQNVKRALKG